MYVLGGNTEHYTNCTGGTQKDAHGDPDVPHISHQYWDPQFAVWLHCIIHVTWATCGHWKLKLTEFLLRGKITVYSNIGFLWPEEKFLQESPYRAPTGKTAVGFMWAHPLEDKCGFAPTVSQFTTTVGPHCLKGHCLIWMSKIWACYPAFTSFLPSDQTIQLYW